MVSLQHRLMPYAESPAPSMNLFQTTDWGHLTPVNLAQTYPHCCWPSCHHVVTSSDTGYCHDRAS